MRFDAHERYISHCAVCPTCRGDLLCGEGRSLLNASRREEGAPPMKGPTTQAPQPAGHDEDDDDDDEADADGCPSCVQGVSSTRVAAAGDARAGFRLVASTFLQHDATQAERDRVLADMRGAIIEMARSFGLPIVSVATPPPEAPKP